MESIIGVAALTHLGFLVAFYLAGLTLLVGINIASILCYTLAYFLARRGAIGPALSLTVVEVTGHAVLTTLTLGLESGFQYYLTLLIPVAVTSTIRSSVVKGAMVVSIAATYFGLELTLRHQAPPELLSRDALDDLYYFNIVAYILLLTFVSSRFFYVMKRAQEALYGMAHTDSLTHLHNRRSLVASMTIEENRVRRGHPNLSFVMLDLDHFKSINDSWGHHTGDAVLSAVSQSLLACLRDVDIAGRWGGEEFLIVMPDTDLAGATLVAERVRAAVEGLEIAAPDGQKLQISLTVGVATIAPGESAEEAITRADAALYEGKRSGRNKVVTA